MTPYTIEYRRTADRELDRLPRRIQVQIREATDALAADARPYGGRKIKGYGDRYRIRVGDYRVVYRVNDDARTIVVTTVGHRSVVYRGLSLVFLMLRLRSG